MVTHSSILAWEIPWAEEPGATVHGVAKVGHSEVKAAQSCPTLCDPMDCSLPGSSVLGILQARILEWVAIPFFLTQGPNLGLLQCRQILYCLSTREFPFKGWKKPNHAYRSKVQDTRKQNKRKKKVCVKKGSFFILCIVSI